MNYRRDSRASRSSLFDGYDGLEEGVIRASSSYSHNINEQDNDKAIESLQDRFGFLKKLTGDIHEEVESHNRLLDRMGSRMDGSRGMMFGTWIGSKRFLRRNQQGKRAPLWHISQLPSYLYTTSLGFWGILLLAESYSGSCGILVLE